MGKRYWRGLLSWMRSTMLKAGNITPEDLERFTVTDSVEAAVRKMVDFQKAGEALRVPGG